MRLVYQDFPRSWRYGMVCHNAFRRWGVTSPLDHCKHPYLTHGYGRQEWWTTVADAISSPESRLIVLHASVHRLWCYSWSARLGLSIYRITSKMKTKSLWLLLTASFPGYCALTTLLRQKPFSWFWVASTSFSLKYNQISWITVMVIWLNYFEFTDTVSFPLWIFIISCQQTCLILV